MLTENQRRTRDYKKRQITRKKSSPANPYTPEQLGRVTGGNSHSTIANSHDPFANRAMEANMESGLHPSGRGWRPGELGPLPPADDGRPQPDPRGNNNGGGGGGGGGAAAAAARQVAALQQLLGSKAFQAGSIDGELGRVGKAVSADQAAAAGQYSQLGEYMSKLANPYAEMEMAKTPTVDPALLRLIAANGGDTAGYGAQVELANTLASQGDSASERLRQQMAASQTASNQSRGAESQMAATYANRELGASKLQMEEALRQRQKQEQSGLDQQKMQVVMQLIAAMAAGGQQVDVSQFFK